MSSTSTSCNDEICRSSTYYAAENGHLECLKYAHNSLRASCEWHPETTYIAVYNGHLECLKYVYENCGDVVTWKHANLEKDFEYFSWEIQEFIESVREDWKHGLNLQGKNIKGCKRN